MAADSYDMLINESSLFQIGEDCYVTIYYHYWKNPHFNNGLWKWDELEVDSWELTGTGPMYDDVSEFICLDKSKVVNGWTKAESIDEEYNATGHTTVIFCYPEYVKIPKGITTIANNFLLKHDEGNHYVIEKMLKHVEIGLGLEKIGKSAFRDQCDLEDVTTENNDGTSVTYIGAWAFYNCNNIKTLDLDARTVDDKECISLLEYIGNRAFYNCFNLERFNYNNVINCDVYGYAFYYCEKINLFTLGSKTKFYGELQWTFGLTISTPDYHNLFDTELILDTDTYGSFDVKQCCIDQSIILREEFNVLNCKHYFRDAWKNAGRRINGFLIFKHNDKIYRIGTTLEKTDNCLCCYLGYEKINDNKDGVHKVPVYIKLSDTYKGIPIIFKKDDKIYYIESNN